MIYGVFMRMNNIRARESFTRSGVDSSTYHYIYHRSWDGGACSHGYDAQWIGELIVGGPL